MTTARSDVVVVGAGPVGLAAALGLGQQGLSVALVGPPPAGRDGRTAALLAGSVELLERLGIWPAMGTSAAPLRVMRLIDDTDSLFRPPPIAFRAAEIGQAAFGWNVENATLAALLARAVRENTRILWHETVVDGFEGRDRARLRLANGTSLEAAVAIAADGRRSVVREACGLRTRSWAYPQRAVTALLAHSGAHRDTSTEFHTRSGPFTLVPLPGRRSSLVWVTSPNHARRLSELDDDAFAQAVQRQAKSLLGTMRVDGPRGAVPLERQSVERLVGPRLALAGEAAHVLPPIGAQGLNLGFADVAALLALLPAAHRKGEDLGDPTLLSRYQRERQGDVAVRSAAVDGLNRALLSPLFPVDALRGFGLGALAHLGPLRRMVMRAGMVGRGPTASPTSASALRPSTRTPPSDRSRP